MMAVDERPVDTHRAFQDLCDLERDGVPASLAIQVAAILFTSLTPASRDVIVNAVAAGSDAEWRVLAAHINHGVAAGQAAVERKRARNAEGKL